MLLGVDVGGTFTDAVLIDGDRVVAAKAPTTPHDQSLGVLDAVDAVLALAGRTADDVVLFAHGMTVATNALLEGRGARTAFAATEGFVDVVELGRQARPELYRLCVAPPAALTPPERRVAVPERVTPRGVQRELTDDAAQATANAIAAHEPDAVAVCLLHAYAHPEHERRLGAALAERLGPDVHVSLSHEVTATFREYERAATTEVDASLSPLLAAYLRRLTDRAARRGLPEPQVMQSSGGLTDAATAAAHAALTVLSGPAAGAAAAALLSARLHEPDLLCFDMGGTSCDVCLVAGGAVRETAGREVGGRPLALPAVDIHTVGAGGGSVAWRDAGGALRVGPRSAGAVPGPACYGRGATEPTVTDAHAVLGRLPPTLSGVTVDVGAATAAVDRLAEELGLDRETTAAGILEVADAEMVRALRVMTVEQGLDPRAFVLVAFGGAGPLHAAAIAGQLDIARVLVPPAAGVFSALGLAAADRRTDRRQTVLLGGETLTDAALAAAEQRVRGELPEPASDRRPNAVGVTTTWECRYAGQSHELAVQGPPRVSALRAAFEAEHDRCLGHTDPEAALEVVTVAVRAIACGPEVVLGAGRADDATLHVPEGWATRSGEHGEIWMQRA